MKSLVVHLFVVLLGATATGFPVSSSPFNYSFVSHGSRSFSATVRSDAQVAWAGVRGVRKVGFWQGRADAAAFRALVSAIVPHIPPPRGAPSNSSANYVSLRLQEGSHVYSIDSRRQADAQWAAQRLAFINSFSLLLDDASWTMPSAAYGEGYITHVSYADSNRAIHLWKNGTCRQTVHGSLGDTLKECTNLDAQWDKIAEYVTQSATFFGMEQFPILGDGTTISVAWGPKLNNTIQFVSGDDQVTPQRLSDFEAFLLVAVDELEWLTTGHTWIRDRGQAAAIACSVIFGVLTLAIVAIAALKFNQRRDKVLPAEQAMQRAMKVYDAGSEMEYRSDEEIFG